MELGKSIAIGKFTIYEIVAGVNHVPSFWVQKQDGEGMQVASEKLEKLLNKFWAEEF